MSSGKFPSPLVDVWCLLFSCKRPLWRRYGVSSGLPLGVTQMTVGIRRVSFFNWFSSFTLRVLNLYYRLQEVVWSSSYYTKKDDDGQHIKNATFSALKMCYRHHGFRYTYHNSECGKTYTPNSACALGYVIFGSVMCVNFESSVNELQFSSPKETPYFNSKWLEAPPIPASDGANRYTRVWLWFQDDGRLTFTSDNRGLTSNSRDVSVGWWVGFGRPSFSKSMPDIRY